MTRAWATVALLAGSVASLVAALWFAYGALCAFLVVCSLALADAAGHITSVRTRHEPTHRRSTP